MAWMIGTFSSRRLLKLAKRVGLLGFLGAATFVAGLQHFVLTLPKTPIGSAPKTNGIVVITGGQKRVADGLALLEGGAAQHMLVSGVGRGVTKDILATELGLKQPARARLDCCVELEFEASNTRGNARAAHQWAINNGYASLLLVTANYHMPRAEFIFTTEMPKLEL